MASGLDVYNLTLVERGDGVDGLVVGAGATAVVSTLLSGAGPAMRLAAVAPPCIPGEHWGSRTRYNVVMSPTQAVIGGNHILGAVVGNFCCIICLTLIAYALSVLTKMLGNNGRVLRLAFGFPTITLIGFQLLYQGTVEASLELVLEHSNDGMLVFVLAWGGLALCAALPFYIFRQTRLNVGELARVVVLPEQRRSFTKVLVGRRMWVNRTQKFPWLDRWWPAVGPYRQGASWFIGLDYAASFFIGTIRALEPMTVIGCGHVEVASAVVLTLHVIVETVISPYRSPRNTVLSVASSTACAAGMCSMAAGHYATDNVDTAFVAADAFLWLALGIVVLKAVLDVVGLVFGWKLHVRLQGQQYRHHEMSREAAGRDAWSTLLYGLHRERRVGTPQQEPLPPALKKPGAAADAGADGERARQVSLNISDEAPGIDASLMESSGSSDSDGGSSSRAASALRKNSRSPFRAPSGSNRGIAAVGSVLDSPRGAVRPPFRPAQSIGGSPLRRGENTSAIGSCMSPRSSYAPRTPDPEGSRSRLAVPRRSHGRPPSVSTSIDYDDGPPTPHMSPRGRAAPSPYPLGAEGVIVRSDRANLSAKDFASSPSVSVGVDDQVQSDDDIGITTYSFVRSFARSAASGLHSTGDLSPRGRSGRLVGSFDIHPGLDRSRAKTALRVPTQTQDKRDRSFPGGLRVASRRSLYGSPRAAQKTETGISFVKLQRKR